MAANISIMYINANQCHDSVSQRSALNELTNGYIPIIKGDENFIFIPARVWASRCLYSTDARLLKTMAVESVGVPVEPVPNQRRSDDRDSYSQTK